MTVRNELPGASPDVLRSRHRGAGAGHDSKLEDRQAPHGSQQHVVWLQKAVGNAAVNQLMSSGHEYWTAAPGRADIGAHSPARESLTVVDPGGVVVEALVPRRPRVPPEAERPRPVGPHRDFDAEEDGAGGQVDPTVLEEAFAAATVPVVDPAPGETVALPDLSVTVPSDGADLDAVSGSIAYAPTVTQAGTVNPFGSTTWHHFSITNARAVRTPTNPGAFAVVFTLNNPITFNVTSPKVSIASADDPAITNANFTDVASDLTPRLDVQGGKPPRRNFWARDLTIEHERFHCNERIAFGRAGTAQAQAWLSGQAASSVADVQALIARVPSRVVSSSTAAAGTVDEKETRAYGAGAPGYRTRADAIRAKGQLGPTGGGYP
jgi:hypothetical protein